MCSTPLPNPSLHGPQPNGRPRGPRFPYEIFVVAALMLPMIFGCSPRIVEHIRYQHDTTYVAKIQVDSVFHRDSIFVKEKNDTVFQYVERIRNHYKFVHDTTYIHQVDTVMCEHIIEKKVEKPLSAWQNFRMVLGTLAMIAIFVLAAFFAVKKWVLKL